MTRFSILACATALLGACNGDPACVIDTDCDLGEYCSLAQRCEAIGARDAGTPDAGEPMDAGEVDSGPVDAGVDSGPEEVGIGRVVAISAPGTPGSYLVLASFAAVGDVDRCTVSEPSEGCVLTACPPPEMMMDAGVPDAGAADAGAADAGAADAGTSVAPNAGEIVIGGGAWSTVTLSPGEDGRYSAASGAMALWSGSDAILTVTAEGGEVPMFGVSLAGTDPVTLTAPVEGSVPVPVSLASDLTATWSGSTPGEVVVQVSAAREGTVRVECRFSPAAGTGTVPAEALAAMGVGAATLTVRSEQSRAIMRSGWDVGVALVTPSGSVGLTIE